MKKTFCILLSLTLCFLLASCGMGQDSGKIKIVTTVFPEYDWVMSLTKGAENVEVTLISDKGVDMHSFQPSTDDILNISGCDLFVYVGGPSDKWVEDVLKNAKNKEMQRVKLTDLVEKTGGGIHLGHSHKEGEECHDDIDEHIWLSLKNAKGFVKDIANKLTLLDSQNKELYGKNLKELTASLNELDKSYEEGVKKAKKDTLIFSDRFPFAYLLRDYGIKYFAAFNGCSADSEADFDTVFTLAKEADKVGSKYLLITDNGNKKLADTVIENTKNKNQKVLSLNSMQTSTLEDWKAGSTYLKIMKDNLKVIEIALGE